MSSSEVCEDKLIICDKCHKEFIVTNYFYEGFEENKSQIQGPNGLSRRMRYVERTSDRLVSQFSYINLDPKKKYHYVIVDECPYLFAILGFVYSFSDIKYHLEVSLKKNINIEKNIFVFIFEKYQRIKNNWDVIIENNEVENYSEKITEEIIDKELINELFILLYELKHFRIMSYLFGYISLHPLLKQNIFLDSVQNVFSKDNSYIKIVYAFSTIVINLMLLDSDTMIKNVFDTNMIKEYKDNCIHPFTLRVKYDKLYNTQSLNCSQFKEVLDLVSSGFTSDFCWEFFRLSEKSIVKIFTGKSIKSLVFVANDKTMKFPDLINIVTNKYNYSYSVMESAYGKKLYLHSKDTIDIYFILNVNGDNAYYDGEDIFGNIKFWVSLLSSGKTGTELFNYIKNFI